MPSMLTAQVVGHVGREPESRYTQTGTQVVTFSVAVDTGRKQGGEWIENTEWVRATCFGKLAEVALERVFRGALVYLSGRMRLDHWTDRDGKDRTTLDLTVDTLLPLSKRDPERGPELQQRPQAQAAQTAKRAADWDRDVPF
jgi:single-strand DNA-binding protein